MTWRVARRVALQAVVAAAAALLSASIGWAQPAPPSAPASAPGPAAAASGLAPHAAVRQVDDVFRQVHEAIAAFAAGNDALVAIGRRTAVVLAGVLLVWGMIKSWVLGKGFSQLLPEFIQPALMLGFALWAVDHLGPTLEASVAAIGTVFAATLLLPGGPPTELDVMRRMALAAFDVLSASPHGRSGAWSELLSIVAHQTTGFLYRLASAMVLMLSGAIAAGVMVMAKVQTALAVLFAPVFIPWGMWPPSAFLFNAWLGFLLTGAMQSVMALAVASLSVQIVDKVVALATSMRADEQMSFVLCGVMFLLSLLVGFLFLKVPALASGLVGGAALNLDRWRNAGVGAGAGVAAVGGGAAAVLTGAMTFGRGAVDGFQRGRHGAGTAPAGRAGASAGAASGRPAASGAAAAVGRGVGRAAGAAVQLAAQARAGAAGFPTAPGGSGGATAAGDGSAAVPVDPAGNGKGKDTGTGARAGAGTAQGTNAGAGTPSPTAAAGATGSNAQGRNATASADRAPHRPYRPPAGTRPVNRPLSGGA